MSMAEDEIEDGLKKLVEYSVVLRNIIQGGAVERFIFTDSEKEALNHILKITHYEIEAEEKEVAERRRKLAK